MPSEAVCGPSREAGATNSLQVRFALYCGSALPAAQNGKPWSSPLRRTRCSVSFGQSLPAQLRPLLVAQSSPVTGW